MQLDRRQSHLHIATFDGRQLKNVVNQAMHSGRVLSNDFKKPVITLLVLHGSRLQCFNESKYRRERSTQFMRNVRQEFLTHTLQAFNAGYVKENAQGTFRSAAICASQGNNTKIENQAFWSVSFYLHAAAFNSLQSIQESTVNGRIAR